MDAVEIAPRNVEIARHARARGDKDRVELPHHVTCGDVDARLDARFKHDAFGPHLLQTAVDHPFLQLEVGDAVAKDAAGPVGLFEDGNVVARSRKRLRGRETGRARSHDGNLPAGAGAGGFALNPAALPAAFDDLQLDLPDRHGGLVDTQRA